MLVLVRHGETEWSATGRHTSRTDVPLTPAGRRQARALAPALAGRTFALVLSSPLQRALETCRLAGFGDAVEVTEDLAEWDYGTYEGRTTAEIRIEDPGWTVWDSDTGLGETRAAVAARADRVLARALALEGDVLLFSHAHLLRVLAARWLHLDASGGRLLALAPGSTSELGWEREQRVISSWNLPTPARTRTP